MISRPAFSASPRPTSDKLNYKQPGGRFLPHQDARAYQAWRVVSVLVRSTSVPGRRAACGLPGVDEVLPVDERGVVRDDVRDAAGSAPSSPGDRVHRRVRAALQRRDQVARPASS
jgi:hypothetical protein